MHADQRTAFQNIAEHAGDRRRFRFAEASQPEIVLFFSQPAKLTDVVNDQNVFRTGGSIRISFPRFNFLINLPNQVVTLVSLAE